MDKPGFCKSQPEIEEFTNSISVWLWAISSTLDMRYFGSKSSKRSLKFLSENKIYEKKEIPTDIVYLSQI